MWDIIWWKLWCYSDVWLLCGVVQVCDQSGGRCVLYVTCGSVDGSGTITLRFVVSIDSNVCSMTLHLLMWVGINTGKMIWLPIWIVCGGRAKGCQAEHQWLMQRLNRESDRVVTALKFHRKCERACWAFKVNILMVFTLFGSIKSVIFGMIIKDNSRCWAILN